ncbi:MAG TPA: hypothetical protein VFQ43_13190 [Nitrososphaera sp.]|nr:hypothetical protein [Nitrososphaera sp.]
MPKRKSVENIDLVPFEELRKATRKILANTKKESDRQLAAFQAANVRKRNAKKKR